MKTALGRFIVALSLCAIALPAALLAPREARAANTSSPRHILDHCPNPAPWWCATGGESDGCSDGHDLLWRGCYDWTIFVE